MTFSASATKEANSEEEIYPNIAAVASTYGDSDGKYLSFMKKADPDFISQPYILWNQPWAEGEGVVASASSTKKAQATPTTKASSGSAQGDQNSSNAALSRTNSLQWLTFAMVGLINYAF